MTVSAFWRRLDTPGHDACRLGETPDGWRLEGAAVFRHALGPARIGYLVICDRSWRSRHGRVRGWIADHAWDVRVDRDANGKWRLDGVAAPGLERCLDLDFGFTPATNILQLRRMQLEVGQEAEAPAAWLDLPEPSLTLLPQRYARRTAATLWYESPTAGYSGMLELAESGFVRNYPGLWSME